MASPGSTYPGAERKAADYKAISFLQVYWSLWPTSRWTCVATLIALLRTSMDLHALTPCSSCCRCGGTSLQSVKMATAELWSGVWVQQQLSKSRLWHLQSRAWSTACRLTSGSAMLTAPYPSEARPCGPLSAQTCLRSHALSRTYDTLTLLFCVLPHVSSSAPITAASRHHTMCCAAPETHRHTAWLLLVPHHAVAVIQVLLAAQIASIVKAAWAHAIHCSLSVLRAGTLRMWLNYI